MFKKAMAELDRLAKSGNPAHELDLLAKALREELGDGFDIVLKKSEVDPGTTDEAAEALRKALETEAAAQTEELRKAQAAEQDDLLVEASEAYGALQKSVEAGNSAVLEEVDLLKKAVGSLLNLSINLAGVLGELNKSSKEDFEEIKKSVGSFGAAPMAPGAARLGIGTAEGEVDELKKSTTETMESLQKAVQDGTVAARYLTDFGTYKNVERLPADVREIIGA